MEILIASGNVHKVRELREMFKVFPSVHLLSLLDFPHYQAPPEDQEDLKAIAITKATHAAKEIGMITIGDDSGLFVPALGDLSPGIRSRRYAADNATDSQNRKKLLLAMQDMEGMARAAYFECCLALALPDKLKICVLGTTHGEITHQEMGSNGFGYESIFLKDGYRQTFAEMSKELKNQISHRHNAFQKLRPTLESLIS